MASTRRRNYAAEYERKKALARAAGYPTYWAQRKAREARPKGKGWAA